VTDSSIALPPDWRSTLTTASDDGKGKEDLGHQEQGSTIAIHSLAVLPEHQGKRVGMTLMKAYIQRIRGAATANQIALLAHEPLIPFYQTLGFDNKGPSSCTFGGGGWFNLVRTHLCQILQALACSRSR
jgi:GNAT superfamily N-acetyltransferase